MNRGGAEREGDTESETGSRLWAVSTEPDTGLELTDREIMTWAEVGRLTDQATQAPPAKILKERKVVLHDIKGKAVSTTASFPTHFAGVTYDSLSIFSL